METIWNRAVKYFCSSRATQNLSRSPSLMLTVDFLYLHRFACFSVFLWGKQIMLLLHSILSFSFYSNPGPRTMRHSCHFLGLYENASSYSKQKNRPLICLRCVHRSTYPEMKTKGTATSKNVFNTSYCTWYVRQLQDVEPYQPWQEGFLSLSDLQRYRNIINT